MIKAMRCAELYLFLKLQPRQLVVLDLFTVDGKKKRMQENKEFKSILQSSPKNMLITFEFSTQLGFFLFDFTNC